jgi:hypothetical protein
MKKRKKSIKNTIFSYKSQVGPSWEILKEVKILAKSFFIQKSSWAKLGNFEGSQNFGKVFSIQKSSWPSWEILKENRNFW